MRFKTTGTTDRDNQDTHNWDIWDNWEDYYTKCVSNGVGDHLKLSGYTFDVSSPLILRVKELGRPSKYYLSGYNTEQRRWLRGPCDLLKCFVT